jgi:hypothetical protein
LTLKTEIKWERSAKVTPANDCDVIMLDTEPFNVVTGRFEVATQNFFTNDGDFIKPLFWAFAEDIEYEVEDYITYLSVKEKDH